MKVAKQKWIDDQCEDIEHSVANNNEESLSACENPY